MQRLTELCNITVIMDTLEKKKLYPQTERLLWLITEQSTGDLLRESIKRDSILDRGFQNWLFGAALIFGSKEDLKTNYLLKKDQKELEEMFQSSFNDYKKIGRSDEDAKAFAKEMTYDIYKKEMGRDLWPLKDS
jgi:hypothetical protein